MAIYGNLYIDQGTSFNVTVFVTDVNDDPIDLAQYTVFSQIRKTYSSKKFTEFATQIIGTGEIQLNLTAEQTGDLKPGRYVYDVKIKKGSEVIRVVEGQVEVNPQVTKITNG